MKWDQYPAPSSHSVCWNPKTVPKCTAYINPLTPKSDQHLNSPYNITTESHMNVKRIKEMTTNLRNS